MSSSPATASFRADDADSLVAASLACPGCLSSAVAWRLERELHAPSADCRCLRCGHHRTLHLSPDQAFRLALHERRPLDPTPRPQDVERVFV